jgi:Trypsin-co-occurring domain 1
MSKEPEPGISVLVVPVTGGRQIGWGSAVVEQLGDRLSDLKEAIAAGGRAIAESLPDIHGSPQWAVKEVTGSFAVTLTAEAGVILSRASAEATVEVSVTFESGANQATSS